MAEQPLVIRPNLLPPQERSHERLNPSHLSSLRVCLLTLIDRPRDAVTELQSWAAGGYSPLAAEPADPHEEHDDYPTGRPMHYVLRQLFARGVDEAIELPDGTSRLLAADQTFQELQAKQLRSDPGKELGAIDKQRRVRRLLVLLEHAFPPLNDDNVQAA